MLIFKAAGWTMKINIIFKLMVFFVVGFVYGGISEFPNLAFPRENEIIYSGDLFIFAEPHPSQMEAGNIVSYEITHRESGKLVRQGALIPESGYETYLPVAQWKNGNYFLKVFYTNPKTKEESPPVFRSFMVENNN